MFILKMFVLKFDFMTLFRTDQATSLCEVYDVTMT